ncbi:hypothetical protein BDM02DRAFT_1973732 [Thelephora ganbajun]|uniref:Uncharacterized protein n=1 Tax=Thelephora ganbajun TaxID=370292 RepID=A0ACB6YZR6_THEGA|nr:hypothetical protein BDM02DRAFT_1973732 [Thelephora ganbajun]
MTDLVGIPVEHRQDGSNGAGHGIGEHSTQGKQKHRDPGDLNDTDQNAAPNQRPVGERESGGDAVLGEQLVDGPRKVPQSTQEDHRATFYEHYRKEAEEYDKDFMKKHDEDLNTTLIFAGLFSAVASAFIVQVQPQLQPDPNEETAALLRVLIHKVDNTTFGGDVPDLPQWTGPPRTIIQVQTVLYASLFASLLSAFLAMLGKQWLNRYASTDMRGSAIERSQNRQRKLDGIVVWYFDHVMESLPVMLQIALLLLGCALSRYLWEIDTTVASVVIGVTSFGVLFYLFIVFAGAASDACPYQTPGANVIRSFLGLLRSPHVPHVESSMLYYAFVNYWRHTYWSSPSDVIKRILAYPFILPMLFIFDALHLGKATLRTLVVSARRAHSWLFGASLVQDQATKLNFHCIVWMLQTSLDKTTNVSTLKFLETILALSGLGSSTISAVVMGCFNVFSSSFITDGGMRVTVAHGSEQLAGMSAMCFLRALSCLLSAEPTSTVIQDVCQRYDRIFPPYPNFKDIPFCFTMDAIHSLVTRRGATDWHNWRDYDPSPDELIPFSRALAQAAKFEYHRGRARTSVWLSHFAFHFLSQDQLPPTLVVLDCLTIIAINFGCNVPHANGMAPDECFSL